jgi:hypothetical protein
MKFNSSILTLLVAALAAGTSWGQLPVSPTSGIIQISLTPSGPNNLVAIPFPKSIPFEGTVNTVAGTTINLTGVTLPTGPGLTNHAIYIATDVNPGNGTSAYGRVVNIVSNTATSVTVGTAITPEPGDEFQILEQWTLETLIGTGTQPTVQLTTSSSSSLSDNVYVESGGSFTGYWHHSGIGWKVLGTNVLAPNVSIPFGKGLLIIRRGGVRTLRVQGEALSGRFIAQTTVAPANNVMNNPFLVETPLIEAGLGVNSSGSLSLSDSVYIEAGGVLTGYWRKNTGLWYPVTDASGTGTPVTSAVKILPGKALLVVDRSPLGVSFPQPFSE